MTENRALLERKELSRAIDWEMRKTMYRLKFWAAVCGVLGHRAGHHLVTDGQCRRCFAFPVDFTVKPYRLITLTPRPRKPANYPQAPGVWSIYRSGR